MESHQQHLYKQQQFDNEDINALNKTSPFQKQNDPQYKQQNVEIEGSSNNTSINEKKWTREQEDILFGQYLRIGSKWAQMSKILKKQLDLLRNPNDIKNKFFSSIRKLVRRLMISQRHPSTNRNLSYTKIMRPLEAVKFQKEIFQGYQDQRLGLKHKIVQLCKNQCQNLSFQSAKELIKRVHKFNYLTKSYNLKISDKKAETKHRNKEKKKTHQKQIKKIQFKSNFELDQIKLEPNPADNSSFFETIRLLDDEEIENMFFSVYNPSKLSRFNSPEFQSIQQLNSYQSTGNSHTDLTI